MQSLNLKPRPRSDFACASLNPSNPSIGSHKKVRKSSSLLSIHSWSVCTWVSTWTDREGNSSSWSHFIDAPLPNLCFTQHHRLIDNGGRG